MLMKNDVTELNPIIGMADDYMTNDLIFTSAGIMMEPDEADDSTDVHSDDESNPTENGILSKLESISIDEWEHGNGIEW